MTEDKEAPLRVERLAGGLLLEFFDRSNRYFGEYHRVHIEVHIRMPLDLAAFSHAADPAAELQKVRDTLGNEIRFTRILEKMAVPSTSLADEKEMLISFFLENSASYMANAVFRDRLIARELARVRQGRKPHLVRSRR